MMWSQTKPENWHGKISSVIILLPFKTTYFYIGDICHILLPLYVPDPAHGKMADLPRYIQHTVLTSC